MRECQFAAVCEGAAGQGVTMNSSIMKTAWTVATLLLACAASATARARSSNLAAYTWQLDRMLDASGLPARAWPGPHPGPAQLSFSEDRLSVRGLCNVVSAHYRLVDGGMVVNQAIHSPRLSDPPDLMALEADVASHLPRIRRFEVSEGAPAGASPKLQLHFADGSRWELSGAPTASTRFGSPGVRVFLEVAPRDVPCSPPSASQRCMRVRELVFDDKGIRKSAGKWHAFDGEIEGFSHVPGMRNVLRIQRYALRESPSTGPSYAYVLDMIVESEHVF